jgi:hypothetical protein
MQIGMYIIRIFFCLCRETTTYVVQLQRSMILKLTLLKFNRRKLNSQTTGGTAGAVPDSNRIVKF